MAYLPMFKDSSSQKRFDELYDACLRLWPVRYEAVQIESENGVTQVIQCGDARNPPLVLFHGVSATSLMWVPNVAELAEHFRIYAVDTLGDIGRSRTARPFRNKVEAAEWTDQVVSKLGLASPNVAGMSYGSFLALNYAVHFPDRVNRVIMISPTETFVPLKLAFWIRFILVMLCPSHEAGRRFLAWTNGNAAIQDNDFTEMVLLGMRKGLYRFPATGTIFKDAELREVHSPVLVLAGSQEVLVNVDRLANRAQKALENCRVVITAGASHTLSSEKPTVVNREIIRFIARN